MQKNVYFENMYEDCRAYEKAKDERMKRRTALVKAEDWEGVKAFDRREAAEFPKPYTRGQSDAFSAYRENLYNQNKGFFEVKDLPWEKDMPDFLSALREAGIQTILVTDQSTGLMRGLFTLEELGCLMIGLQTYTRTTDRWGETEEIEVRGIEMDIGGEK